MGISSDTLANIAAAAMCLVVTYAVAERYILAKPASTPAVRGYRPGDDFSGIRDELGIGRSGLSAVVVVSNSCHFCVARARHSIVNWQRFKKSTSAEKFQTVFLGISGASDAETFSVGPPSGSSVCAGNAEECPRQIPGTPTLILVDENGRVSSSWAAA